MLVNVRIHVTEGMLGYIGKVRVDVTGLRQRRMFILTYLMLPHSVTLLHYASVRDMLTDGMATKFSEMLVQVVEVVAVMVQEKPSPCR